MPDRNHELLDAERRDRLAAYDRGIAEYHAQNPHAAAHLTRAAIDACTLCDRDGYRGLVVCDHDPSHAEAAERARAVWQAELDKTKEK